MDEDFRRSSDAGGGQLVADARTEYPVKNETGNENSEVPKNEDSNDVCIIKSHNKNGELCCV